MVASQVEINLRTTVAPHRRRVDMRAKRVAEKFGNRVETWWTTFVVEV